MNVSRSITCLSLAALALALAGCPSTPTADPIEPGPHITSFTVSKSLVDRGDTVTISWATENTTTVKLENLSGATVPEVTETTGSVDVKVNADSLFVLTASNARGSSERQPVQVLVKTAAHDLLLYALPSDLVAGESASITWSAPDAQSVTLTANPGGPVDIGTQKSVGTVTVTPAVTTVYTLSADGKNATATVSVVPKISTFTANPTSAVRGAPLTLSWTSSGATELTLEGVGRGELLNETDAAKVASGSFTETVPAAVDPGAVYSYVLTAKNAAGVATQQTINVFIQGVPVVKTFTAPKFGRIGQTISLGWSTEETDEVTIAAGTALIYTSPTPVQAKAGSLTLPTPAQKTTYVLTAKNNRGGTDTKSVEVDAVGAPSIANFTALPSPVNAGSPVTLSWSTTYGRKVEIREASEGLVYAADATTDTGTFTAYPNQTTTYTLTIDNTFGETASQTASVTVNNPVILTPSLPGTIISGTQVQLSFSVTGATDIVGLAHKQVDVRATSTGFDDISTTGAKLPFSATASSGVQTVPATFAANLFGQKRSTVNVSVDGYMVFGPRVNTSNTSPVPLPTAKIEPFAVAPYWANATLTSSGGVYWQVKTVNNTRVLIVQWEQVTVSSSPATFQAKVFETGQIDFEYKTLPTGTVTAAYGVQGPIGAIGVPAPSAPTAGSGLTFFGPRPSPVTVEPVIPGPFTGFIQVGAGTLRVSHTFTSVIRGRELQVSEVMTKPDPSIATTGEWVELTNNSNTAVDLTGWQLVQADGGTHSLSGTIPSNGTLVFGQSSDPALNGDAGVSVVLPGLDLADDAESLALSRVMTMTASSWTAAPDAGVARVFHAGPFKTSTGSTLQELTCAATSTYSSTPIGVGTPGSTSGCGFGYVLSNIPEDFVDVSDAGTGRLSGSYDSVIVNFDVSSAPFTFFGTPRNTLYISSNGFISSDSSVSSTSYQYSSSPSTSSPNGNMVIFGEDMTSDSTNNGQIFTYRVAANQNPKAPVAHWVVQWANYRVFGGSDLMDFEIKLFDNGVIEYHYGDMRSGSSSAYAAGGTANVWLENPTGTTALFVSNLSLNPGVSPRTAFRFTPR